MNVADLLSYNSLSNANVAKSSAVNTSQPKFLTSPTDRNRPHIAEPFANADTDKANIPSLSQYAHSYHSRCTLVEEEARWDEVAALLMPGRMGEKLREGAERVDADWKRAMDLSWTFPAEDAFGDDIDIIDLEERHDSHNDEKGKKRKLDDKETEEGRKNKKKKPGIGPLMDSTLFFIRYGVHYGNQCGVINDENLPCTRSHTCLIHSGVTEPLHRVTYYELLPEWSRKLLHGDVERWRCGREERKPKKREGRDAEDTHSNGESTKSLIDSMYDPSFYDPTYGRDNEKAHNPAKAATAASESRIDAQWGNPSFHVAFGPQTHSAVAIGPQLDSASSPSNENRIILQGFSFLNDIPPGPLMDALSSAPLTPKHGAIGDILTGARAWQEHSLQQQLERHGEPSDVTRQMIFVDSDAGPFSDAVIAESAYNWDEWWREMAALLRLHSNFDVGTKMECVMLARSAKIYQRLMVYVYIQMKARYRTPEFIESLRDTLSKWGAWNDLEWLANHHVVRKTLWDKFDMGGTKADDSCIVWGILYSDMNVIQERVMTVLNDRKAKKKFLALCESDPIPVANLFQTLLDQDYLPRVNHSLLARTLVRLAENTRCYPDCIILTEIERSGTNPVAGGGFSDVWKGKLAKTRTVALKAFRIYDKSVQEKALKDFSHEAVIWRQLKHPNILPFYGVFKGDQDFDRLCLVSPWMDAGNVIDYLNRHTDANRLSLLSGVAHGLEYLHLFQPPIIHGDLKGANIFITPSHTACLGDFGLTRFRTSQESTLGATTGNPKGTLRWQAPELLNIGGGESIPWSEKCDIYSFGCVCLEVINGRPPFSEIRHDGAVMMAIAKGQIPQRPIENALERGLDDTLWALMEQCWNFDPALRPGIGQLAEYFQQRHGSFQRDPIQPYYTAWRANTAVAEPAPTINGNASQPQHQPSPQSQTQQPHASSSSTPVPAPAQVFPPVAAPVQVQPFRYTQTGQYYPYQYNT